MPSLSRLTVDRLRNLKSVDITLSPAFNFFIGHNGSGKTSLLEAIHLLSVGRSFRSQKIHSLIADDARDLAVFSSFTAFGLEHRAGFSKSRNSQNQLKLDTVIQRSWADLARMLPLQLINTDSLALIEGGAKDRRRFLDWSMFHVEQSFYQDWKRLKRAIQQRNALLKQSALMSGRDIRVREDEFSIWEAEISQVSERIHAMRRKFFEQFLPCFQSIVSGVTSLSSMQILIDYTPGWQANKENLSTLLKENRQREARYGMTLFGPHRADFEISIDGVAAKERLSRGQLKTFVCLLKIAASDYLHRSKVDNGSSLTLPDNAVDKCHQDENACIFLIDDLASELDQDNLSHIMRLLAHRNSQCFFTAIQASDLGFATKSDLSLSAKFHVEHGKILAD